MKQTRKLIALGLAILLGASPLSMLELPSFATEQEIPDRVLFSSSFETADKAPFESVSDNGYYENVEAYSYTTDMDGEITHLVQTDSIDGSADFNSGESKKMLFDSTDSAVGSFSALWKLTPVSILSIFLALNFTSYEWKVVFLKISIFNCKLSQNEKDTFTYFFDHNFYHCNNKQP